MTAGLWRFAWRNPDGSEPRSLYMGTEDDIRSLVADMARRHPGTYYWAERVPDDELPGAERAQTEQGVRA